MEDHYARKQGFNTRIGLAVLGGIVIALWFLIGNTQQSERVQEAQNINAQIPTIWLAYKEDLYKGEIHSYCWHARCYNENNLNFTTVTVKQGSNIGFLINSILTHTSMDIIIYKASINADGSISLLDKLDIKLDYIAQDTYRISLDTGTYAIIVHATWEDIGYIDYIFSIKVV